MEQFITIKVAAGKLRVHPTTLLRAIKAGELDAYQIGRSYQTTEAALQKYITSKTVGGTNGNHAEGLSESHR